MENNKNKKSVKLQGETLNFYDFIQVFVFTRNHHLKHQKADDKNFTGLQKFRQLFYPAVSYCEFKDKMTNSVDPVGVAHNELPHQNLRCL